MYNYYIYIGTYTNNGISNLPCIKLKTNELIFKLKYNLAYLKKVYIPCKN